MRAVRMTVACAALAAAIAGCSPETETVTLQPDDVAAGADRSDKRQTSSLTDCKPISDVEQRFVDAAVVQKKGDWGGDFAQFRLEGGTVIDSQVLPAGRDDSGLPVEVLVELQQAINACADPAAASAPLTALTGLAKNEVGYRTESADRIAERIWTVRGDLAIGVGVQNDGKLAASAQKLLPDAIDRAKKAPQ